MRLQDFLLILLLLYLYQDSIRRRSSRLACWMITGERRSLSSSPLTCTATQSHVRSVDRPWPPKHYQQNSCWWLARSWCLLLFRCWTLTTCWLLAICKLHPPNSNHQDKYQNSSPKLTKLGVQVQLAATVPYVDRANRDSYLYFLLVERHPLHSLEWSIIYQTFV
jgi:hypothetical protein